MDCPELTRQFDDLPLVTVVTPSYQQGHFIRATIESVLAQDYPRIEYIVMDGGSTDATAAIAGEYASRLRFISEPDRGQSHAINKGFRMARGSIVAWLNSDDILLPGAVSAGIRGLLAHPGAGYVYGEGYTLDASGGITGRFPHTRPPDLWRLACLYDYILQQSVFFRKRAVEDVGFLDESLHWGLDWDLLIRIALKYPIVYLPEFLGAIREYPAAKSSSGGMKRARELHRLLRRHSGMILPPGSLVYGLDTCAVLARQALHSHTPPPLRPLGFLVEKAVNFLAGTIVGRTLLHSDGVYGDGWAGRIVRHLGREGSLLFAIEGVVPDWKPLRNQSIHVECNGRALGRYPAGPGPFQIALDIPADAAAAPLHFKVTARHSVPASGAPWLAGRRRVAFQLCSIGCW